MRNVLQGKALGIDMINDAVFGLKEEKEHVLSRILKEKEGIIWPR